MPETKKETRGGSRGGGRPRVVKGATVETLNLEAHHWEALKSAGQGNKSAGARLIIDAYILASPKSE